MKRGPIILGTVFTVASLFLLYAKRAHAPDRCDGDQKGPHQTSPEPELRSESDPHSNPVYASMERIFSQTSLPSDFRFDADFPHPLKFLDDLSGSYTHSGWYVQYDDVGNATHASMIVFDNADPDDLKMYLVSCQSTQTDPGDNNIFWQSFSLSTAQFLELLQDTDCKDLRGEIASQDASIGDNPSFAMLYGSGKGLQIGWHTPRPDGQSNLREYDLTNGMLLQEQWRDPARPKSYYLITYANDGGPPMYYKDGKQLKAPDFHPPLALPAR